MNNLTTNQKVALGVGAAATVGAVLAAYIYSRSGKEEETDEDQAVAPNKSKTQGEPVDEKLEKAAELRAAGNKAFTNKEYDEAIQLYTAALELSDSNAHLLYSNRSAAFLFKGEHEKAIEDAQKCLDLKPDWSKAYFRMGKALMAVEKVEEAFKQFYKGTLIDKNSEELRVLLEQCSRQLPVGEKDSRAHIEKEMVKLYSQEQCEDICNNVLHVSYNSVKKTIEEAAEEKKLDSLLANELFNRCEDEHPVETYRVLTEILIEMNKAEEAHIYASKAYDASPTDAAVLLLLVTTMLRTGGIQQYTAAFEHMREALRLAPNDVQIVHTYASILLQQSTIGTQLPAPVKALLSELKKGLENPAANHLLIADSGMRLWFKLLEEHTNELIAEEQNNIRNQTSPDEAYIYGLTKGAFSKVCMEPFFQHALSQVVFSNPGLETVLAPFRSAFTSLKPGVVFESLSSFIFALDLQCYRNNYSWSITPDDQRRLDTLLSETEERIRDNQVSKDGAIHPELLHHLALIALFKPLHTIPHLSSAIGLVDLSGTHKWFIEVIKKTLLDHEEEMKIKENIRILTDIPNDSLVEFYNDHVAVWDSAGLSAGRLTTVTVKQELSWLFKDYKPKGFDGVVKTLVVGCGSGGEVYQHATYYKNIELTAIDLSVNNLAFAIRQHKDLGVHDVKFYAADIQQLNSSHFSEPFDLVIANGVIHHLNDPLRGWEKLTHVLRPGGLLRMTLYSGRFVELLTKTRLFLNKTKSFDTPLFTDERTLPLVKRTPKVEEIRMARNLILGCEEKDLEDLKELVTSPQFYALNEFTDLVFHPKVAGFSFQVIGECLNKLGLKLVGFEFPGLPQDTYLRYVVEYPDDPDMINIRHLEDFSNKYKDAFKNFTHTINFTAEKP